jgi:hypothetical protein
MKEIQNYKNKGPGPLQRGDNHKTAKKIEWGHFKTLFSRISELEQLKHLLESFLI